MRSGCSVEFLYADDLALFSESVDGLKGGREAGKGVLESKRLIVNVRKKFIISIEKTRNNGKRGDCSLQKICGQ